MPDGIKVEIDWDKSGTYSTLDDVTAYVRASEGVDVGYGRDQATALAPTVAGSGTLVLKNETRRFTPRNTASPLYPNLKPARPVRITRTDGGVTRTLFVGHTDDQPLHPDINSQTVALTLLDYLADFRGQDISTQLHQGLRTGTAIGYVLDAVGWPTDLRDLDPGGTVIPWWWEDGTDALEALEKILRSEGPPAMLTIGTDGEVIYRDRHHRLTRSASITSQRTFRSATAMSAGVMIQRDGFSYDEAWQHIINAGAPHIDVRLPAGEAVVWSSESSITLAAGEQKIMTVTATDPFYQAITPQAVTDYTLLSGSVSVRLITTAGLSTGIELTAGATGAILSSLQLRANPVTVSHTLQVSVEDGASVEEYGRRSYPNELEWCSFADAEAVIGVTVSSRSQPLLLLQIKVHVGNSPTVAAAVLPLDLSDRVTVVEPLSDIDGDFYIESIQHQFTGEHDHYVIFGLEAVPTVIEDVFILGSATRGILGTNRLGSKWLVDPARAFILGSATNGILGTSILAA